MQKVTIITALLAICSFGCGTDKAEMKPGVDGNTGRLDAGSPIDVAAEGPKKVVFPDAEPFISDGAADATTGLKEDEPCVVGGKELACNSELTCLMDALAPKKGRCRRPCEGQADCAAGQHCLLAAVDGPGGICVTPVANEQSCDGLLDGPRVCVDDSVGNAYPFCVGGTCKLVCGMEGNDTQAPCLDGQVCGTTLHDAPDFGSRVRLCETYTGPKASFGEACDANTPCSSGLTCFHLYGSTAFGVCTKSCTTAGQPCTGGPPGTVPFCILTDAANTSVHYCAFVCQLDGVTYPCPGDLVCSSEDNPPGSGQRSCEPKVQCYNGQAVACADVGQCSGGQKTCSNGVYGPCAWTVGPSSEVCDGKDNDCDGQTDEVGLGPSCAKQAGVCSGSTMSCGGAAGWLACEDADYAAHAMANSQSFEAVESTCDGLDNDCNGQTDEPAACCVADCSGKACGADDGCGGSCLTGTCPGGQSCNAGVCGCAHDECNGDCCDAGELCTATGCCAPQCSGAACGASDGCGGTCSSGSCASGETCVGGVCQCGNPCGSTCCGSGETCSYGSCCTPSCAGQPCGAPDGCGGVCRSGACPENSSCSMGSCVCDHATCDGGCCPAGYDYCRSQSPFGSTLYCGTTCADEDFGCESSSDCCGSFVCSGGLCQ